MTHPHTVCLPEPSDSHSSRNDLRRRVHADAEELKGTTNKAVIPAMVPLQAVQMSSPAYSFRSYFPSSCRRRLRMRSWAGSDQLSGTLSKSTERRVVITPFPGVSRSLTARD